MSYLEVKIKHKMYILTVFPIFLIRKFNQPNLYAIGIFDVDLKRAMQRNLNTLTNKISKLHNFLTYQITISLSNTSPTCNRHKGKFD